MLLNMSIPSHLKIIVNQPWAVPFMLPEDIGPRAIGDELRRRGQSAGRLVIGPRRERAGQSRGWWTAAPWCLHFRPPHELRRAPIPACRRLVPGNELAGRASLLFKLFHSWSRASSSSPAPKAAIASPSKRATGSWPPLVRDRVGFLGAGLGYFAPLTAETTYCMVDRSPEVLIRDPIMHYKDNLFSFKSKR